MLTDFLDDTIPKLYGQRRQVAMHAWPQVQDA
jgi:hypothetical protein